MAWLEALSITNMLIGLIVLVITSGAALITWLYRRVRNIAKEANPVDLDTAKRVQTIETRIGEMGKSMEHLDDRVNHVELQMERVATQKDVNEIARETSALAASVRAIGGMVDTIYKAALSGSGK